jgi:hypothetical protein
MSIVAAHGNSGSTHREKAAKEEKNGSFELSKG